MSKDLIKYLNIDKYISIDFIFEEDLINAKTKYVLLNSELVTGYKIRTINGLIDYNIIEPKEFFESSLNNLLIIANSNIFKKRRKIKNRIQFLISLLKLPNELVFNIESYEFNFSRLKFNIF